MASDASSGCLAQMRRGGFVLVIDSAITGKPGEMNLLGTGKVESGLLQWRGYGRISGFAADLTFSQSTVLIDNGEGRWADGRVSAAGNLLLEGYTVKNISLSLRSGGNTPMPRSRHSPI